MVGRRVNRWRDDGAGGAPPPPPVCVLCGRALGARVEWHHLVPKAEGGRVTATVHPICHRAIHAAIDNATIAREAASGEALRAHPRLQGFLRWIADKPADFHAPTRRGRR